MGRRQPGVTLLEVLVAISIIGMLMSLLLPAIQASREAGRRTQCANNLRQQALAAHQHVSSAGHFPTGGWGGGWVADPDRGSGIHQPGGWVYCLLAYLERTDLRELGHGELSGDKEASLGILVQSAISVFNCPTRRRTAAFPIVYVPAMTPNTTVPVFRAGRSDYAANAGGQRRCEIANFLGPSGLAEGDDPTYSWPPVLDHNGVCYLRSQIAPAEISDGLSHTYLIAEKYLSSANYETGIDHSDDWSMYSGYQDDVCRTSFKHPLLDAAVISDCCIFGSAHPSGWNAAFCDGSVRRLKFDIDLSVHRRLGNRHDLSPIDDGLLFW